MKACPVCGRIFEDDKRFCRNCGSSLVTDSGTILLAERDKKNAKSQAITVETRCAACEKPIRKADSEFCVFCGSQVATGKRARQRGNPILAMLPADLFWSKEARVRSWYVSGGTAVGLVIALVLVTSGSEDENLLRDAAEQPRINQENTSTNPGKADQMKDSQGPPPIATIHKFIPKQEARKHSIKSATAKVGEDDTSFVDTESRSLIIHDLVAYYPFDEDCSDLSENENHGSAAGKVAYKRGIVGRAAFFDGKTSSVEVEDSRALHLREFTLSAWVKLARIRGGNRILEKGNSNSYYLDINQGGRVVVGFYDGAYHDLISTYSLQRDVWHFIVGTYDGSILNMYINGRLENSLAISSSPSLTVQPLVIGWKFNGTDEDRFEGLIDEVRIYRRALSSMEIAGLFTSSHSAY